MNNDDNKTWLEYVEGITPIKGVTPKILDNASINSGAKQNKISGFKISTTRDSISNKTSYNRYSSFLKGKCKIEMTLDLHGHTLLEAFDLLQDTIIKMQQSSKRILLVITGKSRNREIFHQTIRTSLPQWLEHPKISPYIQQHIVAHSKHGGDGARYVILKHNKNVK